MRIQKNDNLKGILCKSTDNSFFLRVYNDDKTFTDYNIYHSDMEIQILDSDAYIYEEEGEFYIDHSPQTLGIDTEQLRYRAPVNPSTRKSE